MPVTVTVPDVPVAVKARDCWRFSGSGPAGGAGIAVSGCMVTVAGGGRLPGGIRRRRARYAILTCWEQGE